MVTEYDVFRELLKHKKIPEIAEILKGDYAVIYSKIKLLNGNKLISKKNNQYYISLNNQKSYLLAKIIGYCIGHELNYNFFLNETTAKILEIALNKETISIKDYEGFNKTTLKKYLDELIKHNFIIIKSKKPFIFSILRNNLFLDVVNYFGGKVKGTKFVLEENIFKKIEDEIKKYKQLSKRRIYIKNIEEEIKFDFIHSTTYLEGNTLTLEETIKLLKHKIYPKKNFDDILEVKNMDSAIDYLFNNLNKRLNLDWILNVHRIIMQGLHGYNGRLRDDYVRILGNPDFDICDVKILKPKLDEFIKNFGDQFAKCKSIKDKIIFSGWVHNEFQHIHPFFDGNSRITRILFNYCLINFGFPLINIYESSKDEYLSLTKLSKKRDDEKFVIFLSKIILDNLIKINMKN